VQQQITSLRESADTTDRVSTNRNQTGWPDHSGCFMRRPERCGLRCLDHRIVGNSFYDKTLSSSDTTDGAFSSISRRHCDVAHRTLLAMTGVYRGGAERFGNGRCAGVGISRSKAGCNVCRKAPKDVRLFAARLVSLEKVLTAGELWQRSHAPIISPGVESQKKESTDYADFRRFSLE